MFPHPFDNRFVRELPADPVEGGGPRQVQGAAYSRVAPTPVAAPRLLAFSRELAAELGLDEAAVRSEAFLAAFSGNRLLPGMEPWAANYGGHQFGVWAGQLGDGRAIGLGEVAAAGGARWELQLKGAGRTPYSRFADGRAVLRSSLREFLCSEAMFHLGVPTTRALCLVATGEPVLRDMFYDGNARPEPGAIVCRVAPGFVRFGTFELPAARGDRALLEALVDFTLARDFPQLAGAHARADWFIEVCERTALLVAHWMRVGFVHGVLNTDNLSILGLTLDYGPYGWLEAFDPDWTPNTTDAEGRRYAFGRQPGIVHWNLARLASALSPLFEDTAPLADGLGRYASAFGRHHARMMADKLGLEDWRGPDDQALARDLFGLLEEAELDHPIFFRELAAVDPARPSLAPLEGAFYDPARREARGGALLDWLGRWGARVRDGGLPEAERRRRMDAANPRIVPRNWLAQEAIDAAEQGDLSVLEALLEACRTPYARRDGDQRYATRRPEWARHRAGCSMLSCSS